jgi:hypothetical protein
VSTVSASGGASASKKPLIIILAVIGVVAIIAGILYFIGGSAVPSFMVAGSHVKGSGHHLARGGVALVVGIAALIGSWFATKSKSS